MKHQRIKIARNRAVTALKSFKSKFSSILIRATPLTVARTKTSDHWPTTALVPVADVLSTHRLLARVGQATRERKSGSLTHDSTSPVVDVLSAMTAVPIECRQRVKRATSELFHARRAASFLNSSDAVSHPGHRADYILFGSAGEAAVSFGSEMEPRGTSALESPVRPAAQPFGSKMPPGRACAVSRHRMTKASRPAPPSRPAALCGIGVSCKGRDACKADSKRAAQDQIPQHIDFLQFVLLAGETDA
jgi:hypothetical protein